MLRTLPATSRTQLARFLLALGAVTTPLALFAGGCGKAVDKPAEFLTQNPKPTPTGVETPEPTPTATATPTPTPSPAPVVCGNLYDLKSANHTHLPDFAQLVPIGKVILPNFDVADRTYTQPFPGVPSGMLEWYGIQFHALLHAEFEGAYQFKLKSDDGSRRWINGVQMIDHDGLHSARFSATVKTRLEAGWQKLRLDYFQGPKSKIALQLFWKTPGNADWTVVPAAALQGYGYGDMFCN